MPYYLNTKYVFINIHSLKRRNSDLFCNTFWTIPYKVKNSFKSIFKMFNDYPLWGVGASAPKQRVPYFK